MATPWILRLIEKNTRSMSRTIDKFHRPVARFMQRHSRIRYILDGSWLGHPLHPAIIPIPIGAWTTGIVLDFASIIAHSRTCTGMADLTYIVGFVGAGAAIVTGLAEWSYLEGNARRVAFVHAASNTLASTLILTSLVLRVQEFRGLGVLTSLVAFGIVGFGGWLGGELAYHYRAGAGRISSDDQA